MDSESPLSIFSIHSNHHISPTGFTRFVRCDSKADISSHAGISKFLRRRYQIAQINLALGCSAPGVENSNQRLKAHWRDMRA